VRITFPPILKPSRALSLNIPPPPPPPPPSLVVIIIIIIIMVIIIKPVVFVCFSCYLTNLFQMGEFNIAYNRRKRRMMNVEGFGINRLLAVLRFYPRIVSRY
jgi:hypothetical protein